MSDSTRTASGPNPLHAAVSLFTIVPVPPVDLDPATARRALLAFPWVGALVGLAGGLVAAAIAVAGGGHLLAAASGLALIALITGGMHLDGLADTADGLASRKPAEQALAIMKRSDVGPMGVGTLVLVLLVQACALASPRLGAPVALGAAPVAGPLLGRLLAVAGTTPAYPAGHAGGFAGLFAGITSVRSLALDAAACGAVTLAAGAVAGGLRGLVVFVVGGLVAWGFGVAWRRHLVDRLGGLTGDTWGSLVELGQLAFWIVVAVAL